MHKNTLSIITILLLLTLTATILTQTAQPALVQTTATTNLTTNGTIIYSSSLISFSGYTWKIRNSPDSTSSPGPNYWSNNTENVWVDNNGWLHLKITYHDGKWYCPEVYTLQALGYGTYTFHTASTVDSLDKNVILGLFTYADDSHEVDIEYSRWGKDIGLNSGFTVQPPPYTSDNALDFNTTLTGNESTHLFIWTSDKVSFETIQGNYNINNAPTENIIKTWQSKVSCDPAGAKVVLNLWLYHGLAPSDGQEVEVIITRFEFTPI